MTTYAVFKIAEPYDDKTVDATKQKITSLKLPLSVRGSFLFKVPSLKADSKLKGSNLLLNLSSYLCFSCYAKCLLLVKVKKQMDTDKHIISSFSSIYCGIVSDDNLVIDDLQVVRHKCFDYWDALEKRKVARARCA